METHQPYFDALKAARPQLPERDHEFVDSLLEAYSRRGWSDRQLYWAKVLAEKVNAPRCNIIGAPE